MKTLTTIFTSALFSSIAMIGTVQADNPISNLTYEDSSNMYSEVNHQKSTSVGILSYGDNSNNGAVWSTEFEQYVKPNNFEQTDLASMSSVNEYMGSNPTAAGYSSQSAFIYNETAGEYHLQ